MCGIYLVHFRYKISDSFSKVSGEGSFAKTCEKRLSDFSIKEAEKHLAEIWNTAKTLALEDMNKRNKGDSISRSYKADDIDVIVDIIKSIE